MSAQPEDTRQLQFFDAATGRYVIAQPDELAHGRPWRMAKASRPLKPKFNSPRQSGNDRSINTVRAQYYQWAIDRKQTITDWDTGYLPHVEVGSGYHVKMAPILFTNTIKRVNKDKYFMVEVSEIDELLV